MRLLVLHRLTPEVREYLRDHNLTLFGLRDGDPYTYSDGFRYWFYHLVQDADISDFGHILAVEVADTDAVELMLMMG